MSHHATEDLAIMRALPSVVVMAPGDLTEAEACTRAIYKQAGTCYLRLSRGGEEMIRNKIDNFQIGKALELRKGEKAVIFSTGGICDEVLGAVEFLKEADIYPAVYTFPTVKPIDRKIIQECSGEYDLIVTVEEHNIVGGFGSAVAEILSEIPTPKAIQLRIGLNDTYSSIVGTQQYLRNEYGMSAEKIAKKISIFLSGK
jgi:transketolase